MTTKVLWWIWMKQLFFVYVYSDRLRKFFVSNAVTECKKINVKCVWLNYFLSVLRLSFKLKLKQFGLCVTSPPNPEVRVYKKNSNNKSNCNCSLLKYFFSIKLNVDFQTSTSIGGGDLLHKINASLLLLSLKLLKLKKSFEIKTLVQSEILTNVVIIDELKKRR